MDIYEFFYIAFEKLGEAYEIFGRGIGMIKGQQAAEDIRKQNIVEDFKTWQKRFKNECLSLKNKGDSEDMLYIKEGSWRKRSDGRYEIRYYDAENKRRSVYATTQKECVKKLNEALAYKKKGIPPKMEEPQKKFTLYEWLWKWFATYKEPKSFNLSVSHLNSIKTCIKKHIESHITNIALNKITSLQIQEALNKIQSSKMRKETRDVYNECLRTAYRQKLIKENPMDCVLSVKHVEQKGQPLTLEEQRQFIQNIKEMRQRYFFLFCLLTGVRPGEGFLMKWTDIDYENNVIHIPGTKTEKSDRSQSISKPLEKLLKSIPKQDEIYLFRFDYKRTQDAFKKACPGHTMKDLRHTFATRCLENGVPMKVVQQWLGHSKYDTTANTYSHVLDDFQRQETSKLNDIFDPYFDPYFD